MAASVVTKNGRTVERVGEALRRSHVPLTQKEIATSAGYKLATDRKNGSVTAPSQVGIALKFLIEDGTVIVTRQGIGRGAGGASLYAHVDSPSSASKLPDFKAFPKFSARSKAAVLDATARQETVTISELVVATGLSNDVVRKVVKGTPDVFTETGELRGKSKVYSIAGSKPVAVKAKPVKAVTKPTSFFSADEILLAELAEFTLEELVRGVMLRLQVAAG